MDPIIHERPDGVKVEYRRLFHRPGILDLEHRELKKDGTPHDGNWYTVTDAHLAMLDRQQAPVLDLLDPRE